MPPPPPPPPGTDLGNPYSNGCLRNWAEVFCTPIPPRWGRLGLQQRAEAHATEAEASCAAGAGTAAEMQMVQLPPPKRNGSSAALPSNGGNGHGAGVVGVEVLPYDEVRCRRHRSCCSGCQLSSDAACSACKHCWVQLVLGV
jgi:hypothetical protein